LKRKDYLKTCQQTSPELTQELMKRHVRR